MICCPNSFDLSSRNSRSVENASTCRKCLIYRNLHQCVEWTALLSYGIGLWAALCAIDGIQLGVPSLGNGHMVALEANASNDSSYLIAAVSRRNPWYGWDARIIGASIEVLAITCFLLLITYLRVYPGEKSVEFAVSVVATLNERLLFTVQRLKDHVQLKTVGQLDHLSYNNVTEAAGAENSMESNELVTCAISACNGESAEIPFNDSIRTDRITSQCASLNNSRATKPRIISSSTAFQKFLLSLPKD